jgi:pantetheine-phosphate adenylyltransferase
MVFDRVIVAIAVNARKQALFTLEERLELVVRCFRSNPRVSVDSFEGLTVDYVRSVGSNVVIRGLRAVADFEYELQMANMNRKLSPGVETLFMMTGEEYFFVSSQNVKEVAMLGGSIRGLVPSHVAKAMAKKISGR